HVAQRDRGCARAAPGNDQDPHQDGHARPPRASSSLPRGGPRVTHPSPTDDVVETVSLYVLDALPADERATFERHLAEGCRTCAGEVARLTPVVGELGHAVPARAPRPEVRERLLARLARPWTIVRADEGGWQHDALGLEIRRLHHDDADG